MGAVAEQGVHVRLIIMRDSTIRRSADLLTMTLEMYLMNDRLELMIDDMTDLGRSMNDMANEMVAIVEGRADKETWEKRARELLGAAGMVFEWRDALESELE